MRKRSTLHLENCQIKSADKFRAVCQALDTIEIETFIGSGRFALTNVFICPDIDLLPFYHSDKPTEALIARIAIILHVQKYGKKSTPEYLEIYNKLPAAYK
jgi:hypothetical protein